jgi:hypothetical protein
LSLNGPAAASSAPRRPHRRPTSSNCGIDAGAAIAGGAVPNGAARGLATNDSTMQTFVSTIFVNDTEAHLREEKL